ncbi:MAG TPA: glycosyl hydrolase-related protein, partial [Deinococcales bacterium]|nr:glycosyl hydrolase-related protein [Deinococcales bacterium]
VSGGRLTLTARLSRSEPFLDLDYTFEKLPTDETEAVYVRFPLALDDPRVLSEGHTAWTDWQDDALPGACREWLPTQGGILLAAPGREVLILSPDVPLFTVGDVVRGRWDGTLPGPRHRVHSYVMNNHWRTNYPVRQDGTFRWRYRLAAGPALDRAEGLRRSAEARRPLVAGRFSFQDFREPAFPYAAPAGSTLMTLSAGGGTVRLVTLKAAEDGRGFVARLLETSGRPAAARLGFPGRPVARAEACDTLERPAAGAVSVEDGEVIANLPARGLASVRFELTGR